jgi:hypothetical protein
MGCAYRGGPYQVEGYSYYERSLGHAMFYGGEMYSAGLTLALSEGSRIDALVRRVELDRRDNGRFHTVVNQPEERWNLEVAYRRRLGSMLFAVGIGADQGDRQDGSDYLAGRGFVELKSAY